MNVLITGCSSGFGLLSAVAFAEAGHRVVASMRSTARSAALREAATARGVEVDVIGIDVCSTASVEQGVAAALERLGSIDVLVNNAGIEVHGAVHLASDEEVVRQFDTNVVGIVRMCRSVVPAMEAAGGGRIINVGSVAGLVGPPYSGLYAASKHAVEALTESMHFELSHRGIRVMVVEPGQFATELVNNSTLVAAMERSPEHLERFAAYREAQRRLVNGEPADSGRVAEVILEAATTDTPRLRWLVGDDARLIVDTKSSMTFEEFEATMRLALDWHD